MADRVVRLLSYNVKMLPGVFGDGDEDLARARQISAAILAAVPKYDVVCLQEVFDEEARAVFVKELVREFPFQVAKSSDHDIFNEDSGLFFASRIPISGHSFVEFEHATGEDLWSDKGIFGARLELGRATLLVFQSHLQSSIEYSDVRTRQLRQLRARVESALLRAPRTQATSCIVCGDFNVVGERDPGLTMTGEYERMLANLGFPRDVYRERHREVAGYTWDGSANHMIPRDDLDKQRLDYVFAYDSIAATSKATVVRPLRRIAIEAVDVVRFDSNRADLCLSDHFAIEALFGIE
jgi:endonuclease/exonuclease/phosphatase family metal-dependent hydrolase